MSLHIPDTLSPSPVLRICQLFPLLNNLVLGINIHSFSADFIYTTDSDSGEVHRYFEFVVVRVKSIYLFYPKISEIAVFINGHSINASCYFRGGGRPFNFENMILTYGLGVMAWAVGMYQQL